MHLLTLQILLSFGGPAPTSSEQTTSWAISTPQTLCHTSAPGQPHPTLFAKACSSALTQPTATPPDLQTDFSLAGLAADYQPGTEGVLRSFTWSRCPPLCVFSEAFPNTKKPGRPNLHGHPVPSWPFEFLN